MSLTNDIRIITYNILADYLNSHEYVLVKKKYLDNEFRIKLLIKQFEKKLNDNIDTIVCLQEVGPSQISKLYIWFNNINYKSIYFKDLVIFYPNNYIPQFIEVDYINSLSKKYLKSQIILDDVNKFNHVYILVNFLLPNKKEIHVCTTHLIANPKFDHIKFLQGFLLAKRLEEFKKVIFCGDFNSKPDSNLYKLLEKNELTIKDIYPKHKKLKIKNNFKSLYKLIYKDEINITTHASNIGTPVFTETIDYIWITNKIKPIKTDQIILRKDIEKNYKKNFLPNKNHPSDHFMLVGYLNFI